MFRTLGWRHGIGIVALASAAVVLPACQPDSRSADDPQVVARAREALDPFKKQLMAALQEGLAEGPEAAIDACRVRAPQIAASLSSDAVRVGRTSHRLRNPRNAPAPWMEPLLDEFLRAAPGEIDHRVVAAGPGRVGYVEPIYLQPVCAACHGEAISASLRERIRAAYPEDRATDFAVGDFRGLFWVELAAPEKGS